MDDTWEAVGIIATILFCVFVFIGAIASFGNAGDIGRMQERILRLEKAAQK